MALSRKIVERFLILHFSPSLLWTTFSDGPFEEDRRALPHYTFLSFSPVDAILRWPFRGRSSSASSLYISLLLSCRRHFAVALSRKIVERFLIIQFSPSLLWTTFCGGPFEEDCRALPHSVSLPLSCGRHSAEDCLAWWRPPPHLTPPLPVSMLLYVHRDRGWVCKRVSLYMSECVCVCLLYPSIFIFSSSFWLMIFLWFLGVSILEMRTILFLLLFVSFWCMHLYFMFTAVSYQMFFYWCSFMWGTWKNINKRATWLIPTFPVHSPSSLGFLKKKKTTWLVIRDVHLFFHTATELWWWRLFFSVAWRPQRPYGQFGTEKPRTSTSTFTQLVSCVVALGLFGAQVCYKLSPLR